MAGILVIPLIVYQITKPSGKWVKHCWTKFQGVVPQQFYRSKDQELNFTHYEQNLSCSFFVSQNLRNSGTTCKQTIRDDTILLNKILL